MITPGGVARLGHAGHDAPAQRQKPIAIIARAASVPGDRCSDGDRRRAHACVSLLVGIGRHPAVRPRRQRAARLHPRQQPGESRFRNRRFYARAPPGGTRLLPPCAPVRYRVGFSRSPIIVGGKRSSRASARQGAGSAPLSVAAKRSAHPMSTRRRRIKLCHGRRAAAPSAARATAPGRPERQRPTESGSPPHAPKARRRRRHAP